MMKEFGELLSALAGAAICILIIALLISLLV
jgi:hypothetical protein